MYNFENDLIPYSSYLALNNVKWSVIDFDAVKKLEKMHQFCKLILGGEFGEKEGSTYLLHWE